MVPQTPSAPPPFLAAEHAWQLPRQVVLQQNPSAQKPDWHWFETEQTVPAARRGAHVPPLHQLPVVQSPSPAPEVLQLPGPH